jgi:hypothetical protein
MLLVDAHFSFVFLWNFSSLNLYHFRSLLCLFLRLLFPLSENYAKGLVVLNNVHFEVFANEGLEFLV